MQTFYHALVALPLLLTFDVPIAFGQDNGSVRSEASWQELTDDPSREQLFSDYVVSAGLQEEENVPSENRTLAIPSIFVFPRDVSYDSIEHKPRANSIFGIDISHHVGDIQLTLLRQQGVRFIYIKATQGTQFKDGKFKDAWPALEKLPKDKAVHRGAYHFLASHIPGKAQADAFVDYVNLHGGFSPQDLPPVVDLEWDVAPGVKDQWVGQSADQIITNALDCLSRIKERTGRMPILYTAKSWFGPQTIPLSRFDAFKDFPLWIADYSTMRKLTEKPALPPDTRQVIWQFTSSSRVLYGYNKGLDASVFYGTKDDFRATFGVDLD